jgi:4-hydroxybenzoate polyprenyltransferase
VIARIRLVVLLARPAVIALLAFFAVTGLAQAGQPDNVLVLGRVLAVVAGFLLFSVACNDLADEAIDRVNLPGRRPLSAGVVTRPEFAVIGLVAGGIALAVSVTLGWPGVLITAAGMLISAAYSLRPVRLADRGALAPLLLPACYVAVPYLLGLVAARSGSRPGTLIRPAELTLLAGLYLGFIGRILLKDFRDVRGDALFGKRTFLVRRGRGPTCAVSAGFWTAGTCLILLTVRQLTPALLIAEAGCNAAALGLLCQLSRNRGARRDERLISAIAIVGRGMVVILAAHLAMADARWSAVQASLMIATLAALTAVLTDSMLRHGPAGRLALADATWARLADAAPQPARGGERTLAQAAARATAAGPGGPDTIPAPGPGGPDGRGSRPGDPGLIGTIRA